MQHTMIQTPRLALRPLQASDWQHVHAYASNPEVVRHMPWGPNRPEDTIAYLERVEEDHARHPQMNFVFAITIPGQDEWIGHCGLHLDTANLREGHFGYVLHPDYWGKGYATESAKALIEFGFSRIRLNRLYATCRPENIASIRVLEKTGLRREAHFRRDIRIRGEWKDSYLYAMRSNEWKNPANRAVIFDMDGVLVDSEPIYLRLNLQVFRDLGIEVTPERYDQFIGVSASHMWKELKDEHGLTEPIEVLMQKEADAIVTGLQSYPLTPMTGLIPLIDTLEKENIPFAVASSSSHRVIHIILTRLNILHRFKAIVSGQDVVNGKPAPDIFQLAASKLGIPAEKCLVIEDSAHGVRGAKAAGMFCAGYANPHSGNQDLSPADLIIHHYDQEAIRRVLALFDKDS